MKIKIIIITILFMFFIFSLNAQEVFDDIDELFMGSEEKSESADDKNENLNLDDLFNEPDDTLAITDNEESAETEDSIVDLEKLTISDKPLLKGSLSVIGSMAVGFLDWPVGFNETYFSQLGAAFDGSAYYSMEPVLTIDVRPTSYFRFYTALSTSLNESNLSFGSPVFGELFIDYTFIDKYFFRVGKQGLTWGQGRLLGNIGNFISDTDAGIAIKSFIPLGMNGLTSLIYTTTPVTNPLYFSYAALYETTIGPFTTGLSAKYNYAMSQELISDFYIKTVVGEVDVVFEARGDFDLDFGTEGYLWPSCSAMTNFFWESPDLGFKILGEYMFSFGPEVTVNSGWEDEDTVSVKWARFGQHSLGFGILATKGVFYDFKPGIWWTHNFVDTSGQFVLGLSGTFAPLITANIAIPIVYGPDYGSYRLNNDDPENRVLSLIVQLKLKSNFSF